MRRWLLSWVLILVPACTEAPATGGDAAATGECCTVTVHATVPEGVGTVYLTGNQPVLGPWVPDRLAMDGDGRERVAEVQVPDGTEFEYKFTRGSWDREALSPEGGVMSNRQLRIDGDTEARHTIEAFKEDPAVYMDDWQGSGVQGSLVYWKDVASEFLGPTRHVSIWLPPGYDDHPGSRYPVLYMHDGQNLFDPRFGGGGQGDTWDVDDAIVRLIDTGVIPPVIVVGAWNSAAFPISEAVAARWSPQLQAGDSLDRTPYMVRDIENGLEAPKGVRYWFDHGTVGGDAGYAEPHRAVRDWLLGQGFVEGVDFVVRVYPGADHNEAAWRDRLEDPLTFLFGRRR